jgi:hypothetical protein
MARVTYGSTITALNGSIGGHTFQRNQSGDIVRIRPLRKSVNSDSQNYTSNIFSIISRRWSNLTLSQRQAWNDFAALHEHVSYWDYSKTVTGFNWFMSCNLNAFYLKEADLDDPPTFVSVPPPPSFSVTLNSTELQVEFSPAYDSGSLKILLFASQPIRQLSLLNRKSLRFISLLPADEYSTIDFKSDWEDYFSIDLPNPYIAKSFFIFVALAAIDTTNCISSIFTTNVAPTT